jgi:hypothetical protein
MLILFVYEFVKAHFSSTCLLTYWLTVVDSLSTYLARGIWGNRADCYSGHGLRSTRFKSRLDYNSYPNWGFYSTMVLRMMKCKST